MDSQLFRNIERRARAHIISPIVRNIQRNFWGLVKLFIDKKPKKSIELLNEIFLWKRIAIIWNSPILEDSWLWAQIDNYDIVIRFNRGICDTYLDEEHTWSKTDFWTCGALDSLLAKNVRKQLQVSNSRIQILVPLQYDWEQDKNFNMVALELLSPYKDLEKFYMNSDFMEQAIRQLWREPSSWFVIIKYLLTYMNPSEIGLYWFSFSSNNRISGETYSTQHNFDREQQLVMDWVEKHNHLTFHN